MRIAGLLLAVVSLPAAAQAQQTLTLEIRDFATVPDHRAARSARRSNEMLLVAGQRHPRRARRRRSAVRHRHERPALHPRQEDASSSRSTSTSTGATTGPGLFHRFFITSGYGNGLNGFHFDPDYRRNGKFYTVHMEDPNLTVSNLPDNKNHPGLNLGGYTTTPTDRHARHHDQRGRAHRVDRHEHVEHDVRRHGPRVDARPAEHAQPPAWAS